MWPLDQKSVGVYPTQTKEERGCREEKSTDAKELVPYSLPKVT